jgi:8-amino-7-oxononanoate synthase
VLAASIKGVKIILSSPNLIKKPLENAKYFCNILGIRKPQSPIVPVIMRQEKKVLNTCAYLKKKGFLVGAIRPPTVPKGTSRLRLAFNSAHNRGNIKELANIIKQVF